MLYWLTLQYRNIVLLLLFVLHVNYQDVLYPMLALFAQVSFSLCFGVFSLHNTLQKDYSFHLHNGDLPVYFSLILLNGFPEIWYYFLQNATNGYSWKLHIWREGCENLGGRGLAKGQKAFRFCIVDQQGSNLSLMKVTYYSWDKKIQYIYTFTYYSVQMCHT